MAPGLQQRWNRLFDVYFSNGDAWFRNASNEGEKIEVCVILYYFVLTVLSCPVNQVANVTGRVDVAGKDTVVRGGGQDI